MNISKLAAVAAILCCLFAFGSTVHAHDYKVGSLRIGHPWTRATPAGAKVAGGYLMIHNDGTEADRLVSAGFAGSASTEVHEMAHANGVMTMRELPKGLEIPAGKSVAFQPGGFHLMFINLTERLTEGGTIKGHLMFEKAGRVEVEFKVEAIGYRPKSADPHSGAGHGSHGVHGHQGHRP